jgi:N-acetylmuramoyl-L-alanine amidase CwlA
MKIVERIITRNFTNFRHKKPDTIVMHTYGGKGTSLYSWFQNNSINVSAHYAVLKSGVIEHYVNDSHASHHAGTPEMNFRSIGIEHQDDGIPDDSKRTTALYKASSELVASLCKNNKIPCKLVKPGTPGIVLHRDIVTSRSCPGGLDVKKIIKMANAILNPLKPKPVPKPPVVEPKPVPEPEEPTLPGLENPLPEPELRSTFIQTLINFIRYITNKIWNR